MLKENKKEAFLLFLDYLFNETTEQEIKEFTRTEIMIRDVGIKVMEINKKLDDLNVRLALLNEPEKLTKTEIEPVPPIKINFAENSTVKSKETNSNGVKDIKRSKRINTSGIYRVSYNKTNRRWGYYYKNDKGTFTSISTKDLNELEEKVKGKGLEWEIIDKEKAKQSYIKNEDIKKDKKVNGNKINGKQYHKILKNNPDKPFKFYDSYKENKRYKIRDDGIICNNYQEKRELCYPHQLLRLFEMIKEFPIKNNNIDELKNYGKTFASPRVVMELLYSINNQMQSGKGDKIDLLYECYENEQHSNPIFKNMNKEIRINDIGTGLSPFTISNWITEINDSYNPKFAIVKLIHDNIQNGCTRKELVTLLFNYENQALLKTLKGGI